MPRLIHVAHSPDSDDAFMFYALAEGKLDTGDLPVRARAGGHRVAQPAALPGELEVTAVSIHAYAYLRRDYALLGSRDLHGRRLRPPTGRHVPPPADPRARSAGVRVAVPGLLTTAYLALRLYQPDIVPVVMPFDRIEDAVQRGEVDVGLLIHEGQLTYADDGLHLWADLGAWWLKTPGCPCRWAAMWCGGTWAPRSPPRWPRPQGQHRLRAGARAPALAHAKQYNRGIGDERTDTVRGDVREPVDGGLRPPGTGGGAAAAGPGARGRHHPPAGRGAFVDGDDPVRIWS